MKKTITVAIWGGRFSRQKSLKVSACLSRNSDFSAMEDADREIIRAKEDAKRDLLLKFKRT